MSLNKNIIERFQAIHLNKFGELIAYNEAELELKELAELVRATTPNAEMARNV